MRTLEITNNNILPRSLERLLHSPYAIQKAQLARALEKTDLAALTEQQKNVFLSKLINIIGHRSDHIRKPTREVIQDSPLMQLFEPQEGKNLSAASAVLTLRFYSFFHQITPVKTYQYLSSQIQKYLPYFKADEYSLIIQSYEKIRMKPQFFGRLEKLATSKLSEMSLSSQIDYLRGLAKLGQAIDDSSFEHINSAVLNLPDMLHPEDNQKLLWSLANLDSQKNGAPLWPAASHIMSCHRGASTHSNMISSLWFDIAYTPNKNKNDNCVSGTEIRIKDLFIQAGAQLAPPEDHQILGFQAPVDMRFIHNEKHIIVEFDGPYHFIRSFDGGENYNGSSLFNARLMAKHFADRVIRIDYHSGAVLINAPQYLAEIFARSVLDKACHLPKGAYHAVIADNTVSLNTLSP